MYNTLFYVIVSILIFDFLFERILDYLNTKNYNKKLPPELENVYEQSEYEKSQVYKKETDRFGLFVSMFSFVLVLGMMFFYGFAYIDNVARNISSAPIWNALIFFGIIMLASDILTTPFSLYSTFVIEEKYGFNKTTVKTFITDKLKGWLLSAIIGGGILSLIIWFFQITGEYFWLWAWGLVTAFSIFMSMFYSNLIVPLFNKQTPLEEGELRSAIEDYAKKVDFKLKNIFVINGSKRSTRANAYFTGLGPKKRIVLYDTLINDLSVEEIVAVLAHEVGHYKKKHTLTGLFLSIIQTGITLYLFSLVANNLELPKALGVEEPAFHLSLIAFGILYSPISFILGIFMNMLSRANEYQADTFTQKTYDGSKLTGALKKLSAKNYSNLTPHPLYVFFNYSHPTLLQRIRAINRLSK